MANSIAEMMGVKPLPLPKGYQRLSPFPIDDTSVFLNRAALDDYVANSPLAYPGQVIALVDIEGNRVQGFIINLDSTLIPLAGGGGAVIEEEIEVRGVGEMGSYKEGDRIEIGTSFTNVVRALLSKRILPVYLLPTIAVDEAGINYVEPGTTDTQYFSGVFAKNDAGGFSYSLFVQKETVKDGWVETNVLSIGAGSFSAAFEDEFLISDGESIRYKLSISYPEGEEIKNDNFGNPAPEGLIQAGSVEQECIFIGKRKTFYGSANESQLGGDVSIRDLPGSLFELKHGDEITINVKAGDSLVVIAVPIDYELKLFPSSIKYKELGGAEIMDLFDRNEEMIPGANDSNPGAYYVFSYQPDVPFNDNATLVVTIERSLIA